MNQESLKIYIADPGSSEMRLGLAGDVVPQYRQPVPSKVNSKSNSIKKSEPSAGNSKKSKPKKSSEANGSFMQKAYKDFLASKVNDSSFGMIVLEPNVQ